jgi:hypothetical protein
LPASRNSSTKRIGRTSSGDVARAQDRVRLFRHHGITN